MADAATWSGYEVRDAGDEIVGIGPTRHELRARCDEVGAAGVELVATDGTRVEIELGSGTVTLTGTFRGLGSVVQHWIFDETGNARIRFAAGTDLGDASAEFDPANGTWFVDGDVDGVNARLQPTLTASSAWRDAHLLLFMLTGLWTAGLSEDLSGLDATLDLAIPVTYSEDVDKGDLKKDCKTAAAVCTVAIFWKPSTAACVFAGIKCFSAFKCWKDDCSGDGKA